MRQINEIIIHCSATRPDQDITAKQIHQYHVTHNKWQGIGYHFLIRLDGTIEGGRPISMIGAHTSGHNQRSIGICYAGGIVNVNGKTLPKDTRTPEQIRSMYCLVRTLLHCFPEINKISGHNEYANKACPCFDVKGEFQEILENVKLNKLM